MADATMAIRFALSQIGKPYLWGATGPDSYDCSGLMVTAYGKSGFNLPRTTEEMIADTDLLDVNANQLAPGDLVFPESGHVQMYLGGGKVVEAPRTGLNVRITNLGNVYRAKRVTNPSPLNFSGLPVSSEPINVTQAGLGGDLLGPLVGGGILSDSDVSQLIGKGLTDASKAILKPLMEILKVVFLITGGAIFMVGGTFLVYKNVRS